ncbi:MAG: DnaJ-class molecular chaperone [Desulforhopalus sp.]|jgi:DnaJ-class molecular chaperone
MDRSLRHQWSIFEDVFDDLLTGFVEHRQPVRRSSKDITIEITLSPTQAQRGGNVRINLPVQMNCPSCYHYSGSARICWRCNGTGSLQGEKPVQINYPAGISNNHTIRFALKDHGGQHAHYRDQHTHNLRAVFTIRWRPRVMKVIPLASNNQS